MIIMIFTVLCQILSLLFDCVTNLKQNETQNARAESTLKGVN